MATLLQVKGLKTQFFTQDGVVTPSTASPLT